MSKQKPLQLGSKIDSVGFEPNIVGLEELLKERERITHDFVSGLAAWLEEFNRVTDNLIESLRAYDSEEKS